MQKPLKNYAFIDSQNVNLGIREVGWNLSWKKFRIYLKEKYGVEAAYMFIGYMEENQDLYLSLQKSGYVLIFKEILKNKDGFIKGNCDAELVLQAMIDYKKYKKAVIVSGDGDFACLVRHLKKNGKLAKVLVPNAKRYSALLKKAAAEECLDFMNNLKDKLFYKKPEGLTNWTRGKNAANRTNSTNPENSTNLVNSTNRVNPKNSTKISQKPQRKAPRKDRTFKGSFRRDSIHRISRSRQ